MKKAGWMTILITGILVSFTIIVPLADNSHNIYIIAHRGGAAAAPENTLAALKLAIEAGADMAEFDLQMTQDGTVVALHDETLLRTTGIDCPVTDITIAELQSLDAGIAFSPFFSGEQIPTLNELLDAARGNIALLLELKGKSTDTLLLEQTISHIRSMKMEYDCLIGSMDRELLHRCKAMAPEIRTVFITKNTVEDLWTDAAIDSVSINFSGLTPKIIQSAHQSGRSVYVWTVNTQIEMETAIRMGVDGIVTDDTALGVMIAEK